MIVYHATKAGFRQDVATGSIAWILLDRVYGLLAALTKADVARLRIV